METFKIKSPDTLRAKGKGFKEKILSGKIGVSSQMPAVF